MTRPLAVTTAERSAALPEHTLLPPEPGPPKLLLQAVPEEKAGKNRMHLDLDAADIEVEAQRLEALGARRQDAEVRTEFGTTWIQMADPEGNEFCVFER